MLVKGKPELKVLLLFREAILKLGFERVIVGFAFDRFTAKAPKVLDGDL